MLPRTAAAALALATVLSSSGLALGPDEGVLPGPPCDVPADVMPGAVRVDGGPTQAVRIRFAAAAPLEGTFGVWFAVRASAANRQWPAERALAAGFLEAADGAPVAVVSAQTAIYPYGVQADAAVLGVRADAADGACWGAFGGLSDLSLPAGRYDLVVVGASEAGSRFAAFLPPGAAVEATTAGPATLLSSATFACAAKARAFAAGVLVEALEGCATPLPAQGRAYRSLVATWGPSEEHDVRWRTPDGAAQRCYKAPGWCFDTGSGAPGTWTLEIPTYRTIHQPSPRVPLGADGYSGIFGVFAGRP